MLKQKSRQNGDRTDLGTNHALTQCGKADASALRSMFFVTGFDLNIATACHCSGASEPLTRLLMFSSLLLTLT